MSQESYSAGILTLYPSLNDLKTNLDVDIQILQDEVYELTETMLQHDYNNCAKYFSYNLQNKRKKNQDVCDEPLFLNVKQKLWSVDTLRRLVALHDNYEPNPLIIENVTKQELDEEIDFLASCFNTSVMNLLCAFFIKHKIIKSKLYWREIFRELWFKRWTSDGSCAFEHVFLGEFGSRGSRVNGVHNWVFFLLQERSNKLNYYGFDQALDFGKNKKGDCRGGIITSSFEWNENGWKYMKSYSGMFIGFSPEMELALFTLAYLLNPGRTLSISLGGSKLEIQTHISDNCLHSAYPRILEERHQLNEIVSTNAVGKLRFFSRTKRFGFIRRVDTKEDVFVHSSEMWPHLSYAKPGYLFTFKIKIGLKGNIAFDIKRANSKKS